MSVFPTSVDPVNEIFRIVSLAINSPTISEEFPMTRFTTPSGRPASSNTLKSSRDDKGASRDGRKITVQPTANAGPNFLALIDNGKFHGVIAPTTPIGCFVTEILLFGADAGTISP